MGKFDGLLLASDFDGTLYDHHLRVPERNLQAITYFTAQGGRFTVSTGRTHRTFSPFAGSIPINAPVVLSNGAALWDLQTRQTLETDCLPDQVIQDMTGLMERFPALSLIVYDRDDVYLCHPNEVSLAHMKVVGGSFTVVDTPAQIPTPWLKALLHEENSLLLQVQARVLQEYAGRYEAVFSDPRYLEFTGKGVTKGNMVLRLARRLGIRQEHIYCVGDHENDLSMLAVSAIPFAPANCTQQVRDSGARVLCHCDGGVIGDIVEILDRMY